MSDDQAYDPIQLGYDPDQQADPAPYGPPAPPDFTTAGGMTGNNNGAGYTMAGYDGTQMGGQHNDPAPLGPSAPTGFDPGDHLQATQIAAPPGFGATTAGMTGNDHGIGYTTTGYDGTPIGAMTDGPHHNPTQLPGFDTVARHHEPECLPMRGFDPIATQADIDRGPQMFQGHPYHGPTNDQVIAEQFGRVDAAVHAGAVAGIAGWLLELNAAQMWGVGNTTDIVTAPGDFAKGNDVNHEPGRPVYPEAGRPLGGQVRHHDEPPRR